MILLDGEPLKNYGLYLLKGHSHPAPAVDSRTLKIPDRPGLIHFGNEIEARSFHIPVGVLQSTPTETQEKMRKFTELLFDQYGQTREIELRFTYEPEKYYKVKFDGGIDPQRIFEYADFNLPLTAFDPYAYAPATYYDPDFIATYNTDTEYDDGVTEYKNQTHTPFKNARQYAGVFNYSHYATPFSFVIEGYVKNPKITNTTSGVSAQFNNVTVEADERLYFDSKLMTTWKVKADEDEWFWLTPYQMMRYPAEWDKLNRYNDMSGHFLELVSGDNTILFEGENPDAQVNFRWEHRFL